MINTTSDYSQFQFHELNRGVDATHIRRLKKHIKEHGLVQPIIVTADGTIIDGQHRFHVCRELGIDIQYIIRDEMDIRDVVRLNNMSKGWTVLDKVESYAAQGDENYIRLLEFWHKCKEIDPKISIRTASMLVQGSAASYTRKDESNMNLGAGTWEFRDSMENSLARLYAVTQFKPWGFHLKTTFITALLRCMRTNKEFDWKLLHERASKYPHLFVYAGTTDDFLRVFENVYNHKRRGSNRIRLF